VQLDTFRILFKTIIRPTVHVLEKCGLHYLIIGIYQKCIGRPHANRIPSTIYFIKISPITGPRCPEGFRNLRFPDYVTMAQKGGKVVSLTYRPALPPENTPGTHFCYRLSRPQGHSAIGRITPMKNSNDTIWNRTRDLPICSIVP
jgi:hypothetical protein